MKKIYAILIFLIFFTGFAAGEGYFENRLGASADADGTEFGKDLFTIDKNDKSEMHFAEYAEFGYSWEMAEINAFLAVNNQVYDEPKENIKLGGYGIFSPKPFLSIAAGNDTRDRFSFGGAELFTENGAYLLQGNPFKDGLGLIFTQDSGNVDLYALASLGAAKGTYLNVGAMVNYENDALFASLQALVQNLLNKNDYYHYGVFALCDLGDFSFSAGYISNYNDQEINDFERESLLKQDYLPLPSTHVVKASLSYSNELFMIAADGLSGLNKEYILNGDCKKLRAAWDINEKYGRIQTLPAETASLGINQNIPWLCSMKGGFFAFDDISLYLKCSVGRGDDFIYLVYPYIDWTCGEKSNFRLGARFKIVDDKLSVSLPLLWTFRLDIK